MNSPRVSIGLPVYNGERYLAQALDSILAQTFSDFELIVSDNGSTDTTQDLCKMYASRDRRVRYYRNERNVGVARNFNRVFELSSGKYFVWMSHDDVYDPHFIERSVEVLDNQPDVILAHARMCTIDEHGQVIERYSDTLRTDLASPHRRFYQLIRTTHRCAPIYGLMRAKTLALTPLIGNYTSSDVALLARLGLLGRIHEIPEYLFYSRRHTRQSMRLDRHARSAWFDPANVGGIVFPEWRLFWALLLCVKEVPLPWPERAWCLAYMLCWPTWMRHWRRMVKELILAMAQILGVSKRLTEIPTAAE